MARIIFDAVAVADLAHHFQVEHGALIESLRLDQLPLLLDLLLPPVQLRQDAGHGLFPGFVGHHVVRLGVNRQPQISLAHLPQQRIDLRGGFSISSPNSSIRYA